MKKHRVERKWRVIPELSVSEEGQFWARVRFAGPNECWEWRAGTSDGYGVVQVGPDSFGAHRVAYTLGVGPIPPGLTIDHVKARGCKSKLCVNPAHLEVVTQSVNSQRAQHPLQPCSCGKPRGPKQRRCPECHNAYFREYRQKNLEKCKAIQSASYERIGRETRRKREGRAA